MSYDSKEETSFYANDYSKILKEYNKIQKTKSEQKVKIEYEYQEYENGLDKLRYLKAVLEKKKMEQLEMSEAEKVISKKFK